MILKCLYSHAVDPDFLGLDGRYRAGFLDAAAIREYVGRTDYELPSNVVESALAAGDQCFAIHEGETLAVYQWYSLVTNAFADTVDVQFRPGLVYLHHAFTHPRYRGRRLNAFATTLALRHYLARGYDGIACCVERDNESSLRSFSRIGFRHVGTIVAFKIGRLLGLRHPRSALLDRFVVYTSPGCKALGFRFVTKRGPRDVAPR